MRDPQDGGVRRRLGQAEQVEHIPNDAGPELHAGSNVRLMHWHGQNIGNHTDAERHTEELAGLGSERLTIWQVQDNTMPLLGLSGTESENGLAVLDNIAFVTHQHNGAPSVNWDEGSNLGWEFLEIFTLHKDHLRLGKLLD